VQTSIRLKMRKGKRITLSVFNRFSGLPRILIWGWTIWSVAFLTTLLIFYAPPPHAVIESASKLISYISTSDNEILSAKVIKPEDDSGFVVKSGSQIAEKQQVPSTQPTHTAKQIFSVSVLTPELPSSASKKSEPIQKKTVGILIVETVSIKSDIVKAAATDLKFFRSHPDSVSHGVTSEPAKSVGIDKNSSAGSSNPLADNHQKSAGNEIFGLERSPEIVLIEKNQPNVIPEKQELSAPAEDTSAIAPIADTQILGPTRDEPASFSSHIADISEPNSETTVQHTVTKEIQKTPASEDSKQKSGNKMRKDFKMDSERFTTHDWHENTAEWNKLDFKGVDHKGHVVEMTLLVLSGEFFWRFAGQSIITDDGQSMRIRDHLASSSLRAAIKDSKGIVSVGTASEEGTLRLEKYRANLRADRLMSMVIQTQPQINAVYTLSLGQHQKISSTNSAMDNGPSSNEQRRIILISITRQDLNADLAEAIENGLSVIPGLPYELSHFSHFDLKNKASAF